jgi:uncharacterized protein (TIGR00297 family)
MLAFALLLRYLTQNEALVLAAIAILFNLFALPRTPVIRDVLRKPKKYDLGIIAYPVSVFFLILFFPLWIAAAAWAIFALGDSFATLFGWKYGGQKLPWNPEKSWAGFLAFFISAFAGALFFSWWVNPAIGLMVFPYALLGALFGAAVETVPIKIDDNLTVPIFTGAFLLTLSLVQPPVEILGSNILNGLAASTLVAMVAFRLKAVNVSGLIAGIVLGTSIYAFLGYQGFLILFTFFVLGSACSKLCYAEKEARGTAQPHKGARQARHAFANSLMGAFMAFLAVATPYPEFFTLAFLGAFAAATADTMSNEIGQVLAKKHVLITTFRPSRVGVDGAISIPGTLTGALSAMMIACIGYLLGMLGPAGFWLITGAGIFGMTVDSYLGATLQKKRLIGNESVNFLCTVSGALFCLLVLL